MSDRSYAFASDNAAGICPEACDGLAAANHGYAPSYGDDPWTAEARRLLADVFETACEVFFVFNGTAANALALGALGRSHESIFCHEIAHVDTDECSAPEFFSGGSKVLPLEGAAGKISPDAFKAALKRGHGIHYSKPGSLSLTQATEWGTLYQPEETAELAKIAHAHGARVQLDGARFANAAAAFAERGIRPADLTWRAGIDVLSLGGTKNGMLGTEAIVFFRPELARDFAYRMKQAGQLGSKQRFAGAQWAAMLRNGAWLRHAAHANAQAAALAAGLERICPHGLALPRESNAVFPRMDRALAERLEQRWAFYNFIGEDGYRLMCSWATRPETVAEFLRDASPAAPR